MPTVSGIVWAFHVSNRFLATTMIVPPINLQRRAVVVEAVITAHPAITRVEIPAKRVTLRQSRQGLNQTHLLTLTLFPEGSQHTHGVRRSPFQGVLCHSHLNLVHQVQKSLISQCRMMRKRRLIDLYLPSHCRSRQRSESSSPMSRLCRRRLAHLMSLGKRGPSCLLLVNTKGIWCVFPLTHPHPMTCLHSRGKTGTLVCFC